MSLRIAVVGAPGSGKTLFCINWCEYLGATRLYYYEVNGNGNGKREGIITPQAARDKMVCNAKTGRARTFIVNRPGCYPSRLALIDTPSLKEKADLTTAEKIRLYLTLQLLFDADIILNLVDLSCTDPLRIDFMAEVDRCLLDFSAGRSVLYKLVGNKADLVNDFPEMPSWAVSGPAINISAKEERGFDRLMEDIVSFLCSVGAGEQYMIE